MGGALSARDAVRATAAVGDCVMRQIGTPMNKSGFLLTLLAMLALRAATAAEVSAGALIERVGDTGFVRVEARSFETLDGRQQQLGYWLAQAAIAIDPIVYDQFSIFGLREKRLLEGIMAYAPGTGSAVEAKIASFTKLVWANRGNHNLTTAQKFLPAFGFEELQRSAHAAMRQGAFSSSYADLPALRTDAQLDRELEALRRPLFDAQFEPMVTAKSPGPGQDLLQASCNTFYAGVTLADLKDFKDVYALNSRVVKDPAGAIHERVYRAGTPDGKVPAGLYAIYLRRANGYLAEAQRFADPAQRKVIGELIRYYQTGDFADWLRFGTEWVQNDANVDFDSGFIEVYHDPRGAKGSSQAFVTITDRPITQIMTRLGEHADYFEQQAPWDAQYKRQAFKPPVVKAVETLVETGDFNVNVIGDNLPNEDEIHEKYGSKNFLFSGSTRAFNSVLGHTAVGEFAATVEIAARNARYGDEAEDLHTALHEVIGHGSGRLSDRLKGGAAPYLKEYFSTLEEARADLMALWNTWDPKLAELGLVSAQDEVAKAMYDSTVMAPLLQLRRIPRGDTIEEDHQRDRQLIVNYIRERVPGAVGQFERDGKTYAQVQDYEKMHQGVGLLLAELMRIKAEGDYAAIKALVDQYGVHFEPALRDQVIARYQRLDLPTYWAGINARLTPKLAQDGNSVVVQLSYPRSVAEQYLAYASMYDRSLRAKSLPAAANASKAQPGH
jgi:dipeptidyl-peptidase III